MDSHLLAQGVEITILLGIFLKLGRMGATVEFLDKRVTKLEGRKHVITELSA